MDGYNQYGSYGQGQAQSYGQPTQQPQGYGGAGGQQVSSFRFQQVTSCWNANPLHIIFAHMILQKIYPRLLRLNGAPDYGSIAGGRAAGYWDLRTRSTKLFSGMCL